MKLKDLLEQYGEYDIVLSKREATNEIMIEGRKPKPKTVWDLKEGDKHHWVDVTGDVCTDVPWEDSKEDKCSREIGNVFLTEEEAEKDVERRKVETLLLKHGGRRWFKNREYNYFLRDDDHLGNGFWIDEIKDSPVQGAIYFDTYEDVEKAIKEIGAERIKRALFEVR